MYTLCQAPDGSKMDLQRLLETACSNKTRLQALVERFLKTDPQWKELAKEAARKYEDDLSAMQPNQSSHRIARQLGLSLDDVQLANRISLISLFGYSHYLKASGFEIREPTDFQEIAARLSFARNAIAKIGFDMISSNRGKGDQLSLSSAQLDRYENGFILGGALGYLTMIAHTKGSKAALDLLTTTTLGN